MQTTWFTRNLLASYDGGPRYHVRPLINPLLIMMMASWHNTGDNNQKGMLPETSQRKVEIVHALTSQPQVGQERMPLDCGKPKKLHNGMTQAIKHHCGQEPAGARGQCKMQGGAWHTHDKPTAGAAASCSSKSFTLISSSVIFFFTKISVLTWACTITLRLHPCSTQQ